MFALRKLRPPAASYSNGKDTVFVLFNLAHDANTSNQVFNTIKYEAIENNNLIAVANPPQDPAYIKVGKEKHVFFAWTRNLYIFSIESLQGWSALDDFIRCFPH